MPTFDDPRIEAIYLAGQKRIDEMKAALPADGMIPLPFRCYSCDEMRSDFRMKTGDGLPLCGKCFDGCVDAMSGAEAAK